MEHTSQPSACLDPDLTRHLSGLEILQKMIKGELPGAPIRETLNFWLVAASEGEVEFRSIPQTHMCNPFGAPHGGWYGTVLDSAMGCAVHSRLAAGVGYTTLEYKVNITRSVPLGMEVSVKGYSQHAGRSTAVSHAEMRGVADGKLYATGSTTCIILRP